VSVTSDPELFQAFKEYLIAFTGLAKDALHVHIGLLVYLSVRLAWRRKGGWFLAWIIALAVTMTGEYLDLMAHGGAPSMHPDPAHWHDIWNTMLWPTVLLLVGRWLEPRRHNREPLQCGGSSNLLDQPLE
jgi:hypothetical protein